jgi:hypothetical protein
VHEFIITSGFQSGSMKKSRWKNVGKFLKIKLNVGQKASKPQTMKGTGTSQIKYKLNEVKFTDATLLSF